VQKQDQIADLFKETFENYEAPVRSGLWEQVSSRIETVTPPAPDCICYIKCNYRRIKNFRQHAVVDRRCSFGCIHWYRNLFLSEKRRTKREHHLTFSVTTEISAPAPATTDENTTTPVVNLQNEKHANNSASTSHEIATEKIRCRCFALGK
jgi:hypothetical protein